MDQDETPKYYIDPKTGKKKKSVLSDESYKALVELGEVLRGIHNDMIAQGYEMKDGKIVKRNSVEQGGVK